MTVMYLICHECDYSSSTLYLRFNSYSRFCVPYFCMQIAQLCINGTGRCHGNYVFFYFCPTGVAKIL